MMLPRIPTSKFEVFAYFTMILGVLGDHISTSIALSRENYIETNPVALNLMQNGIWVQFDAFLIITSVIATFMLLRTVKNPLVRLVTIFPFIIGLLRLVVTIWNVSLLI
jgi:hypothetical protein